MINHVQQNSNHIQSNLNNFITHLHKSPSLCSTSSAVWHISIQFSIRPKNKNTQMKSTCVEGLVEGFAEAIAQNFIAFDETIRKYEATVKRKDGIYIPKFGQDILTVEEEQFLMNSDNFYYQEFNNEQIGRAKNNVFEYYFEEQRARLQEQNLEWDNSLMMTKAAANFKNLSSADKLGYLKKYLKETRYKGGDRNEYKPQSNQLPLKNTMQGLSYQNSLLFGGELGIPSLFNHIQDNGRRSLIGFGNKINFQESANNEPEAFGRFSQNKGKKEINKNVHLPKNNSQKWESQRADDPRDKVGFQTLKSLFKKLQNSS